MNRTIKSGILYRDVQFDRKCKDDEKRSITFSFSSEEPVDRPWGREVLDHSPGSADFARLNNGAPLLVGHNQDDQVGVIESAAIQDKRGVATVRFGKSARANEIWTDVSDGIRRNVSVGYRIHEMKAEKVSDDGPDTYRAVSWTPLEVSIVSVPADASVGIGRKADDEPQEIHIQERSVKMDDTTKPVILEQIDDPDSPNVSVVEENAKKTERDRMSEITAIANRSQKFSPRKIRELAEKAIREGMTVDQFRQQCMDIISNASPILTPTTTTGNIGMDRDELRQYSWSRAIMAAAEGRQCFERDISDEYAKKMGRQPAGFWIPPDVLSSRDGTFTGSRGNGFTVQRDLSVGTAGAGTAGGTLVGTNLLGASFIELLRNRMIVVQMGATVLEGLTGNVAIPRQTGANTANWSTEQGSVTESNATFDSITLSPKGVSSIQDYSKQLLLQSTPSVDALIRTDLGTTLALAQDLAALHGTGANNQPTGIAATTGIGSVECGVNGAIPTWVNIVDLETKVSTANADVGSLGYVTNAKVRGMLKAIEKAAGTAQFIWTDAAPGMGQLNGYRAGVTNQVSSTLEKGGSGAVCSAVFFGNWSDLILGQWGGLDVLVDPYTLAATRTIRMVSTLYCDIAIRHAASFAAILDALTA